MSSKENYFRILCLTFETAAFVLRQLIDQHLQRKNLSLKQFIDKNQHDIYHMYSDRSCCKRPCTRTISGTCLNKDQIMQLFDTNEKAKHKIGHRNQYSKYMCCCLANQSLTLDDIDFSLLRILLINFCQEEFWIYTLKSYEDNFEKFLEENKHNIFHLSWEHICCCQCRTGYDMPKKILKSDTELKLYIKTHEDCQVAHAHHTCNLSPKHGMTFMQIKQIDLMLFQSLTNHFCEVRKAIENVNEFRNNKIAHVKNLDVTNEDFEMYWKQLERNILDIASAANCVSRSKENIKETRKKCIKNEILIELQEIIKRENGKKQDNFDKCAGGIVMLVKYFLSNTHETESEEVTERTKLSICEGGRKNNTIKEDNKNCQENNNEHQILHDALQKEDSSQRKLEISDQSEGNTHLHKYTCKF